MPILKLKKMIYIVNYCLIDVHSYPFSMPFVFIFLKALWDKALEFRFLLQKAFSSSHRLPQVLEGYNTAKREETQSDAGAHADGDPELLDDSEFYQQLLKEFFGTIDPATSGIMFMRR
ncbi:uncharacterized protein LOC126628558 isoform X2 [Malus sylvestris]|uniref:uncharacterized protein n=1 Tax=Malus domestica TaxID=3750 RepID=UPI000498BA8E|nr:uncharacterized protein LOC103427653 isoform X1 [Malus domestica]XP_050154259.1 uncharacterized protein LOC126628558 isoform X2 [Malus sylvestris]